MIRSAPLLTLALLFVISTASTPASEAPSAPRPQIVAHRGANAERPENTLSAFQRAIDVGANVIETDVRTSRDGILFLLHDATLDRSTDGSGPANVRTMAELKKLDAGGRFDETYRGERIPTLGEALQLCRDKTDVLLDLKEEGDVYAQSVARDVKTFGDPARTILGVRSVEQARRFRRLLPQSRQLGFLPDLKSMDAFIEAGVEIVRLWPNWLVGQEGAAIVDRVHKSGVLLQINGTAGLPRDVLPLLRYRPDLLLVDNPAALKETLDERARYARQIADLADRVEVLSDNAAVPWIARPGAISFLNRDYHMLELPETLHKQPRFLFAGGEGDRVVLRFAKPAVVFAAFEYNTTGNWSFSEGYSAPDFGWKLVQSHGYRGTSNAILDGQPHYADVFARSFESGDRLDDLPPWWLCLAIVPPETANRVPGFAQAAQAESSPVPPFIYGKWAVAPRPLRAPAFVNQAQWSAWQRGMREKFRQQFVFPYDTPPTIVSVGEPLSRDGFTQQELHVLSDGKRLFRFFRLTPQGVGVPAHGLTTIVCFMGHGKVRQILEEKDSYQHACAARFAERGYLVFAMENVGMEPDRDAHLELDRLLRLDGYGWYGLLFAHQQILLHHVFADPKVNPDKVGATGVSTGGLLALSAIAMEPRVAAASVQGIFGSMRISFIRDRNGHCSCGAIPGLLPDFDLPEMALLAAPRALHISNAAQDGFGPEEARQQVERITPHYVAAGGQEPLFTVPPGRHEYAFAPALKFFEETLGAPDGTTE